MYELDFSGKRVIVTGGYRGIGYGIAEAFASKGASVAVTGRDAAAAARVAADLTERYSATSIGVEIDVTSVSSVRNGIHRIVAELGGLDIAVNNAGVANSISFKDLDEDAWDRVMDTNLKGVYACCRAELAVMGHGSSLINIASISGSMVNVPQFQANYNTSKAGVIMLTKSLAVEYAPQKVRVNSVSPGYTLTDMNKRPEVQDLIARWTERTPLGRLAEVSEVAGAVLFLASPMAGFITGHDLVVDGGITILC